LCNTKIKDLRGLDNVSRQSVMLGQLEGM